MYSAFTTLDTLPWRHYVGDLPYNLIQPYNVGAVQTYVMSYIILITNDYEKDPIT